MLKKCIVISGELMEGDVLLYIVIYNFIMFRGKVLLGRIYGNQLCMFCDSIAYNQYLVWYGVIVPCSAADLFI